MTGEDIMNFEYDGNYAHLMYDNCPIPNANIVLPEAANMYAATAVEAGQTCEMALEPELMMTVSPNDQYFDIRDLKAMITASNQSCIQQREQEVPGQSREQKQSLELWQQRQLELGRSKILKVLLSLKESGIIDGFVYGLVHKGKETVSAASENLRSWWKEKARFDRDSPVAILGYNLASSSSCPGTENITANSLFEIQDTTLGSLVSALMQQCNPPQKRYPFEKGMAPLWWPTGKEEWWGQLDLPVGMGVPPYRKPHNLRKPWKVTVLVAMVKHLIADSRHMYMVRAVRGSKCLQQKMSAKDNIIWSAYIDHEKNISSGFNHQLVGGIHMRPNAQHCTTSSMIDCDVLMDSSDEEEYYDIDRGIQPGMPAGFLLHQSPPPPPPVSSPQEAAASNELYNMKGKAVVYSDNPSFNRWSLQELGSSVEEELHKFINSSTSWTPDGPPSGQVDISLGRRSTSEQSITPITGNTNWPIEPIIQAEPYLTDTSLMDKQIIDPNHIPLDVADYSVESFPNLQATGDWLSSGQMDQLTNLDDIDWDM